MPNKGFKHSAETRAKMSKASKLMWQDLDYREIVIKTRVGSKRSNETKAKMSAWQKGKKKKPLTEEHKKNIGKALEGRVMYEEHKAKMSAASNGSNSSQWLSGISHSPYSPKFNKQLRVKIRERDNHTCQLCGVEKNVISKGEILMAVHHIDYDKTNCSEDNLITLCTSCNFKANGNREMWQQYFECKLLVA